MLRDIDTRTTQMSLQWYMWTHTDSDTHKETEMNYRCVSDMNTDDDFMQIIIKISGSEPGVHI